MKISKLIVVITASLFLSLGSNAQTTDSLGLPGDNLNLYAVLKVFRESPTLEQFEKTLNDEKSKINNLDLNGDDKIDYIRVVDNPKESFHAIVLQVAINEKENQDVAVIEVDKDEKGNVKIQVIGDEELYGKDYIIEPNYDATADNPNAGTPNPGYEGKKNTTVEVDGEQIVVNDVSTYEVAQWPVVRYIYMPTYVIWVSPWYYHHYPHWWNPWRPFYWHYYYGYHSHYHYYYYGYYRRWNVYRHHRWHYDYYYRSRRTVSVYVSTHRQAGGYRVTYSRPYMRKEGSDYFIKTNPVKPKPSVNRPLINRPTQGRPGGISKPVNERPAVIEPGKERPVNKPGIDRPVSKPVDRPVINRPTQGRPGGVTRPGTNKPDVINETEKTRPASKDGPKRGTKIRN